MKIPKWGDLLLLEFRLQRIRNKMNQRDARKLNLKIMEARSLGLSLFLENGKYVMRKYGNPVKP